MEYIIYLLKVIEELCRINIRLSNQIETNLIREYKKELKKDSKSPLYNDFTVDKLPIIRKQESDWYYKDLIKYYKWRYNVTLNPIKRRKKIALDSVQKLKCPRCKALSDYIYTNNGKSGQCLCKVCKTRFVPGRANSTDSTLEAVTANTKRNRIICPYCNAPLSFYKKRSAYIIYRCNNDRCDYYLNNLKTINSQTQKPNESRKPYKLRYSYRFIIQTPADSTKVDKAEAPINFSKNNAYIMALAFTFHINFGLSLRQTKEALKTQYNIDISHQQIANYCGKAAEALNSFLETYPYKKGRTFIADETYIKVSGKRAYVWFIMDAKTRAIIAYKISECRGIMPAITVMRRAFSGIDCLSENFRFVADGFSIYPLAAAFFDEKAPASLHFKVTRVKGLCNANKEDAKHRPYK